MTSGSFVEEEQPKVVVSLEYEMPLPIWLLPGYFLPCAWGPFGGNQDFGEHSAPLNLVQSELDAASLLPAWLPESSSTVTWP